MRVVQRVATNTTEPEITAGMPLTVDILGDKRTVMNYIITPVDKSWKSAFWEQ